MTPPKIPEPLRRVLAAVMEGTGRFGLRKVELLGDNEATVEGKDGDQRFSVWIMLLGEEQPPGRK